MSWHPRDHARAIVWQLRNGLHGQPYGEIHAIPIVGASPAVVEYELRDPLGVVVGRFTEGDDAAIVGWARFIQRSAGAGEHATVMTIEGARAFLGNARNRPHQPEG